MNTKTLHQSVAIQASAHDLYEALMDSKKHAAFTGADAKISREVGGKFSVFDDWATGVNVELIPDMKIVQKWRGGDWPEGYFSEVTFVFKKTKNGTRLEFTQTDIPEEFFEDMEQGWIEWYWEKLKSYFEPGA